MPFVEADGLRTHYEVLGNGPPILMFSPGGFDAHLQQWSTLGVYERIGILDQLSKKFTCIVFDRRENGESGGRVEQITWKHYVDQAVGLLDGLDIESTHLLGGCMGCSPVAAFSVNHPDRVLSAVYYWPVGGARYRLSSHQRFSRHIAFVEEQGLQAVVDLVRGHDLSFSRDPRGGPWGQCIRNSREFADSYATMSKESYLRIVTATYRGLFDRDTAPGAEPEDLMNLEIPSLIVPGDDDFHATSAAQYLKECLSGSQYWDQPADKQLATNAPQRIIDFLASVGAGT